MKRHYPLKKLAFFCACLLSSVSPHPCARAEDIQATCIINANGADSTNGSFVLRIDMFGNNDKWDEVSAPRISAADIIDVARKTLARLTPDSSKSQVQAVELVRFNDTPFWYYSVTFGYKFSTKVWEIPVLFSGIPVPRVS